MNSKDKACQICTLNYTNTSTRKKVNCPSCLFVCCKTCIQNYLLNTITIEPKCMKCKQPFDYITLVKMTTKTFVKTRYKNFLMNIIFQSEENLLNLAREEVAINAEIDIWRKKLYSWVDSYYTDAYTIRTVKMLPIQEIVKLTMNSDSIMTIHNLFDTLYSRKFTGEIIKCSVVNCNGIIYTNTNKKSNTCNLCKNHTCLDCYTLIGADTPHVCNKETLESIQFIKKNSKNCPKCNIRISHIEGCNQMFCVYCNTAFDWSTLTIYKSLLRYHNPHHTEYIKTLAKSTFTNTDCDTHLLQEMIREILMNIRRNNTPQSRSLKDNIANMQHTRAFFNRFILYKPTSYLHDLRKKFVGNLIDKSTFLNLYWRYKVGLEKNDILDEICTNMFITISELIIQMYQDNSLLCDIPSIIDYFYQEFFKNKEYFT